MRQFVYATLLATFAGSPALAQKVGQVIDVGGWKIASDVNKDGSTGCTATFVYDDKSAISFALDNDETHMFVVLEPTAKMKVGAQTKLSYRIDDGKSFNGVGIAASGTLLAVPIAHDELDSIYTAFQKGNNLYIKLGDEEFEEPLEGSSNAINALGACQESLPARKK